VLGNCQLATLLFSGDIVIIKGNEESIALADIHQQRRDAMTSEEFIGNMTQELKWNGARISQKNQNLFSYHCYAGSSVIKVIKDAAKKLGGKVKVTPIVWQHEDNVNHEYEIEVISGLA